MKSFRQGKALARLGWLRHPHPDVRDVSHPIPAQSAGNRQGRDEWLYAILAAEWRTKFPAGV